jgi:hypothetical protein
MCKYSNKMKNTCQKVVGGISLLLGLFGVILLAMGVMAGGGLPPNIEKMLPEDAKKAVSGASGSFFVGLGVLILATSLLGCATAKFKNPCFAIPFGILTSVFGLILLILGFIAMAVGSPQAVDIMRKAGCGDKSASNPLNAFDNQFNEMVVKPMCSEICPCTQSNFDTFEANIV